MFKKYAMKVSNSFGSYNNTHKSPPKSLSRSDSDGSTYSSDCDYNIPTEVNRDLFIENYLIGRGGEPKTKTLRSGSLCENTLCDATTRYNNYRSKSSIVNDKRDDRLVINKNHLFANKSDKVDRAVSKHRISIDVYPECSDDALNESSLSLKKLNTTNNFRDFFDLELSIIS
jgi:hypothetical protein